MYTIKEMPVYERPRERGIKYGVDILSTQELLAILLRNGTKEENVLQIAMHLLREISSLNDFNNMTFQELCKIKGIGPTKAITVLASIEFGKRIMTLQAKETLLVTSPKSVYLYVKEDLMYQKQEHFICIYLDSKGSMIEQKTIFIGTLNATMIHPREIFNYGVKYSSAGIILVHNHPSGNPTPSENDKEMTRKIVEASHIMGIDIIDHIIIGKTNYFSFAENGLL